MPRFQLSFALLMSTLALSACVEDRSATAEPPELVDETATLLAETAASCRLTEIVSPSSLPNTERGGFSSDGRFFAIGSRPADAEDAGSWLVELVRAGDGYSPRNYVAGTLEGTEGGVLGGDARGDACLFSGFAVHGDVLYAGCYALDGRVSLLQVDTKRETVRAGAFTSCNFEPQTKPCKPVSIYPNGFAADREGRIYVSDMTVHILGNHGKPPFSIAQITIGPDPEQAGQLDFSFRAWRKADRQVDGPSPNGIQIKDDTLYFVGGPNVNAVPINPDGSAGRLRVHYRGPVITYIDDFGIADDEIVIGRAIPGELVGLDSPPGARSARAFVTCPMPFNAPSSVTYQPELAPAQSLFPPGTMVITSFFGGGIYTLAPLR
jgi:hypothetical protein